MKTKNQSEYDINTYSNEKLHVVLGHNYRGEGYSGITDGQVVTGVLTEVNIQHDHATLWSHRMNIPCAVKLRSLFNL